MEGRRGVLQMGWEEDIDVLVGKLNDVEIAQSQANCEESLLHSFPLHSPRCRVAAVEGGVEIIQKRPETVVLGMYLFREMTSLIAPRCPRYTRDIIDRKASKIQLLTH